MSEKIDEDRLIFRKVCASDFKEINQMLVTVFTNEQAIPSELVCLSSEFHPKMWCVTYADEIIGSVAVWFEAEHAHVGRFAISKKYRGLHLGTRLLKYALDDIFTQDVEELYMEARPASAHIIRLLGGKSVGEPIPFYEGDIIRMTITRDDYLMVKHICLGCKVESVDYPYSVADYIASGYAVKYNPILFYSKDNCVIEKLMQQIGEKFTTYFPEKTAILTDGDKLNNDVFSELLSGHGNVVRRYCNTNLLLFSRVDAIEGRPASEEYFYNVFDTLYLKNCQIVLGCSVPPNELLKMSDRVITQLESGLIIEIHGT